MVWVYDNKTKKWVDKPASEDKSGKGVSVRPMGGGGTTVRPMGAVTESAPFGRDGFGQPLKSAPVNTAPFGLDGFGQPLKSAPVNTAPYGRDGLGNPLPAPKAAPGVPQGPGQWGPIGSAEQVYGMLKNKYGFDGEDNTPGEMDKYSPLGDLTTLMKSLLSASGSGGGGGGSRTKPTISRAALKKALTSAKNEISQAYNTAGSEIGSSFANNPYAGLTAQETTADPGLSALFQSQGVSPTDLEQMVGASREAASQRAAGMNDLYKLLGANYSQNAAAQQAGIQAQRASSLDDLLQQYAAILGSGKVY